VELKSSCPWGPKTGPAGPRQVEGVFCIEIEGMSCSWPPNVAGGNIIPESCVMS